MRISDRKYILAFILNFTTSFLGFAQTNIQDNSAETLIELSTENIHNLTLLKSGTGEYNIETTGHDPYLFTQPLLQDSGKENHILSFEYFCASGIDRFQVFLDPPITENQSKTVGLPLSEGWATFSMDLTPAIANWGKKGNMLRLDFGNDSGRKIQIRNIRLRPPTARELEREAKKAKKLAAEAQFEQNLKTYLNKKYPASLTNITVTAGNIILTGTLEDLSNKKLYLAEIPIHQDLTEIKTYRQPLKITLDKTKKFKISLLRHITEGNTKRDLLFSKWVIVQQTGNNFIPISAARYADQVKTDFDLPLEKPKNKKGLGGFIVGSKAPVSDLDDLNIGSVTVNIWLNQMLRASASENNISFNYNGKTYYADKKWLARYDQTLQETANRNIIVSAIILVQKAVSSADKKIGKILEHPDCDPAGIYSMPNLTTAEGVEYYAAALDFLANRYSRPDKKYGRIHHWIAHNEVDAGWEWTNMGEKSALLFMDTYHKSMRMIHLITRQYNPHAKVFISLTHFWNYTPSKHFYHSRDLLELLLKYSKTEGDFEWAIAQHPYPEDLFEPKTWLDKQVNFTFDTPLITYKNIEVLNAWVNLLNSLYLVKYPRTIHLSEQGLNSREYTPQHLQEQAAGMAYAWQKIKNLKNIEAFQYHNWMDNRGEGGLRIGLRRFPDDAESPAGAKPIWHVFKSLDTAQEENASAFALPIIGIKSWPEIMYKGGIK